LSFFLGALELPADVPAVPVSLLPHPERRPARQKVAKKVRSGISLMGARNKIRNQKPEIRRKSEILNPNLEAREWRAFRISVFVLPSDF